MSKAGRSQQARWWRGNTRPPTGRRTAFIRSGVPRPPAAPKSSLAPRPPRPERLTLTPPHQQATWTTRFFDGRDPGKEVRIPLNDDSAALERLIEALGGVGAVADLLGRLLAKCRGVE